MSLTSINVNNTLVASVDSEPTAGSENLVKSGGVNDRIVYETGISDFKITYLRYDVGSGMLYNDYDTEYHASQKIPIARGGITKIIVSSTFNVIMFYDSDNNYLGWNRTGDVINGSAYFVVGFDNARPFIAGSTVIAGGLKDELNKENQLIETCASVIGYEQLHQVYSEYNVNTGVLTPGDSSGPYPASQKINLQEGQTIVKCSFNPNAFLFYDENDSYLGWNRTGDIYSGSAYVVIGLDYNMSFDDSMYYLTSDNKTVLNRIYELEKSADFCFWKDKIFTVLGDSLSENYVWENKFAEITGATYIQGYSKGGEQTISASGNCGMDRALKLLSEHPEVNVIFIQNINDMYLSAGNGQITDLPYMMTQNILSNTLYGSAELAL